jgi:hypothetical protein
MFQLNKMEMRVNEIHICVCLWDEKYMKSLSLELVKLGSYDFHYICVKVTGSNRLF